MTRAGPEPWICGACRSVNEERSSRCYKCRTPRALAEADVSQLIVAGAGVTESTRAVTSTAQAAALGGYRSSDAGAGLAQCLLAATGVLAVISSIAGADLIGRVLGGETETVREDLGVLALLGFALYGSAAVTLVCWAAWLSRVIDNVPKVGLGWPNLSPTQAFIENLLPGLNLFRVPAILRDVITRLEPDGGRGNAMIAAAWLGLVGGVFLPAVTNRLLLLPPISSDSRLTVALMVGQLALGLTLVGIAFLIAIIRRIEAGMRAAARNVEGRRRVDPTAEPTEATA
jgi:hypothetical protein